MTKKLFVGSLSWNTTDQQLADFFKQAGNVVSAQVIMDRNTGRARGFGFVEMETEEEAQKAVEMLNGKELDGRAINVNEAKPQAPRDNAGGGGYNRDFRGGGNRGGGRGDNRRSGNGRGSY